MKDYLTWLISPKRWVWWVIIGLQIVAVALPTSNRIQYGVVLFWVIMASLWNFSSAEWRSASNTWKELYLQEEELSLGWQKNFYKAKNIVLNKQNPSNS